MSDDTPLIRVMIENFQGTWLATARDEFGEFTRARADSKAKAKEAVKRKIMVELDRPFEIQYDDITESANDE